MDYLDWNDAKIPFNKEPTDNTTTQEVFLKDLNDLLRKYNIEKIGISIKDDAAKVIFYSNGQPLTLYARSVSKDSGYYNLWKRSTGFILEQEAIKINYKRTLIKFDEEGIYRHTVLDNERDEVL